MSPGRRSARPARISPKATAVPSPARQLAAFLSKFDPGVRRLAQSVRREVRRQLPTAVELVYDNYNALAIGFGPTERATDAIVSVAVYARAVNLYFIYGARLADPDRLLIGNGTRGRFMRATTVADVRRPPVVALVRAAARQSRVPLAVTGRGYTVIKSISARQRSRRPAK